jgi:hypothetical protein
MGPLVAGVIRKDRVRAGTFLRDYMCKPGSGGPALLHLAACLPRMVRRARAQLHSGISERGVCEPGERWILRPSGSVQSALRNRCSTCRNGSRINVHCRNRIDRGFPMPLRPASLDGIPPFGLGASAIRDGLRSSF